MNKIKSLGTLTSWKDLVTGRFFLISGKLNFNLLSYFCYMRCRAFFILFTLTLFSMHAQLGKEAWNWKFGNSSCLVIDNSGPNVCSAPPFGTSEGCASWSDPNTGQLLLFASPVTVLNKNGAAMTNGTGLIGHYSATQGALIIPKPGSTTNYYVFTSDQGASNNKGVHWHEIDLSLSGGLGAVILKNQVLTLPPTTEKLVAVKHCNGLDYWVITHPLNSNCFYSYLVSQAGINLNPIISCVGTSINYIAPYYNEAAGYLKASTNGKRLALGVTSDSLPILELFDFDNVNGVVSNALTIKQANQDGFYGVSFSPDNNKLYTTCLLADTSYLLQYDLTSNIPANIINSELLIVKKKGNTMSGQNFFGALQLASDGKIYLSRILVDTLGVISAPNLLGPSCNFSFNGTGTGLGTLCQYGLPNFVDANYAGIQLDLPDIKQCTVFLSDTVNAGPGFTNYAWSTGASTQSIVISNPGTYWVTVTNTQGCTRTDTIHAYLITPGTQSVTACVADTINTTQSIVLAYNWSDGSTNPIHTFTVSGVYWEDVSFIGGCTVRDSFIVTINPNPVVNLGNDTLFCKGTLPLNAGNPSAAYMWSTGESAASIIAQTAGIYWVQVNMKGCIDTDTLVIHPDTSKFEFTMPNIVTPNGDNINDWIDFNRFQLTEIHVEIYNRWGQKIFENDDLNVIWGPKEPDGTYFYTASYRVDCGSESRAKVLKGFITIVR